METRREWGGGGGGRFNFMKIGYIKCHDLVLNSLASDGLDVMG